MPTGVVCRECGSSEFKTYWQTFTNGTRDVRAECAKCGAFAHYLPQALAHKHKQADATPKHMPAPKDSDVWLGLVRLADGVWRAVAKATTLAKLWDVILSHPSWPAEWLLVPSEDPSPKK
jgi:hypothetical protein